MDVRYNIRRCNLQHFFSVYDHKPRHMLNDLIRDVVGRLCSFIYSHIGSVFIFVQQYLAGYVRFIKISPWDSFRFFVQSLLLLLLCWNFNDLPTRQCPNRKCHNRRRMRTLFFSSSFNHATHFKTRVYIFLPEINWSTHLNR